MYKSLRPCKGTILLVLLHGLSFLARSQDKGSNSFLYPDIQENRLYETKWKYINTLDQHSQTIVHHSTEEYKNYLYFKLNKSVEIYLNGIRTQKEWNVKGPKLYMPFRDVDSFMIVKLDGNSLVLEYNNKAGRGTYEYHFNKLEDSATIFKRPDYLLPEVKINSKREHLKEGEHTKGLFARFWDWIFGNPEEKADKPEPIFVNIEVIGGGYYGGIDPAIKNYIQLKTNGLLIREYETAYKGLVKTQKSISREELEQFVEYIDKKGFFELPSNFECIDPRCLTRLNKKPVPIPLRISVTYGIKHKVINVPIYGLDE
ncbi:MAG TPA: hypothetical protein VK590_11485, partial [Saprospiraceae bacterium]|nr:hypothetical protein [Saprospiraceae bacterium]